MKTRFKLFGGGDQQITDNERNEKGGREIGNEVKGPKSRISQRLYNKEDQSFFN